MNAERVEIALDNMEQVPAPQRARALMGIVRNIRRQAEEDPYLVLNEIDSIIVSGAKDVNCA